MKSGVDIYFEEDFAESLIPFLEKLGADVFLVSYLIIENDISVDFSILKANPPFLDQSVFEYTPQSIFIFILSLFIFIFIFYFSLFLLVFIIYLYLFLFVYIYFYLFSFIFKFYFYLIIFFFI